LSLSSSSLVAFPVPVPVVEPDLISHLPLPTPVAEHTITLNEIADDSERRNLFNSVDFAGVVDNDEFGNSVHDKNENSTSNHSNSNSFHSSNVTMSSPKKSGSAQEESETNSLGGVPSIPPLPNVIRIPPSPIRTRRADVSKMGRSINRPVEEKPLLDEIREVVAQSYLMFLLADLRHMSATGRISTKFEDLAIDSDVCKRDTAKRIACLSDSIKDDEVKQVGHFRGLSPAVIMAIVILEIRDTAVKTAEEKTEEEKTWKKGEKKNKYATSVDIDNDDQFVGYENNKRKKKLTEESMESLMRCYSRLVSEDLKTEIPNVRRRRETYHPNNFRTTASSFISPSEANTSNNNNSNAFSRFRSSNAEAGSFSRPTFSSPFGSRNTNVLGSVREEEISSRGLEVEPTKPTSGAVSDAPDKDGVSDSCGSIPEPPDSYRNSAVTSKDEQVQEAGRKSARQLFSPGKWNSRERVTSADGHHLMHQPSFRDQLKMTAENSKQIADRIKTDFNHQVDNLLPTNHEANTRKEFQELTDVFFDQGEVNEDIKASLGASYSRKEMVDVMRNAVRSRNDSLQFLSKMFKDGSISKLMAESHARIVWVNDWYPMKDLTYAISVDPLQRRVMVVFRGAITAEDWKSAFDFRFHKILNPVKDDFEGKKKVLRVFSGLYTYLFRKRKDTGTTKYDEIANMAHKYGLERIGPDYKLFVTGHSLGGALTHFFSFYASTDERFTKNGPVKGIAFASPYIGGHSWADSFRHQERMKKLQLVQVRNSSDVIPRIPANFLIGKRGPLWRHVGIGVTLPRLPKLGFKWKPLVHYWGKEKSCFDSTMHGYRRNILFHFSYLRPWTVNKSHTLFELQDRLMYGELNSEDGGGFLLLQSTLDELYEKLEENDFDTFSQTKWWGLHRRKGETEVVSA
jgi:hypothetical protein